MNNYKIITLTKENYEKYGFYCVIDKKSTGYKAKCDLFLKNIENSLKINLLIDSNEKQLGFIEYTEGEKAWRPVEATNFLFINCIMVKNKADRNKSVGSTLINSVIQDAEKNKKSGVCVMTSNGSWIADKSVFEMNDFEICDKLGRFELMCKKFDKKSDNPKIVNWNQQTSVYKGWNIVYSDQCPWHEKSVNDMLAVANQLKINVIVTKIETPEQARKAPTGFGTFGIIHDGKIIEDHYISATRFKNILNKQKSNE